MSGGGAQALVPRLDPRRNAFRPDLADTRLAGRVEAQRYVSGRTAQVTRAQVPLRRQPIPLLGFDTEALFGETVRVFDEANGWAWVQLDSDGYVGYLPADTLTADVQPGTHQVRALGTFVYPEPDIKAPPILHLSINARLSVVDADLKFVRLRSGGFVIARHVAEIGRYERDIVEIAERLVGTPYLWGGKTRLGLDCSGLVQVSLQAAGIAAPRDSDMQQHELGASLPIEAGLDGLERGDIVFWNGHVGIMADGVILVHANAHHMAVVVETLPEAVSRIGSAGSAITAIKRIASRQMPAA